MKKRKQRTLSQIAGKCNPNWIRKEVKVPGGTALIYMEKPKQKPHKRKPWIPPGFKRASDGTLQRIRRKRQLASVRRAWLREEKRYLAWLRKVYREKDRRERQLWGGPVRKRYERAKAREEK